ETLGRHKANASAGRAKPVDLGPACKCSVDVRFGRLSFDAGVLNISLDAIHERAGLPVVAGLRAAYETIPGDAAATAKLGVFQVGVICFYLPTAVASVQTDISTSPSVCRNLGDRRSRCRIIRIDSVGCESGGRKQRSGRSGDNKFHRNAPPNNIAWESCTTKQ